MWAARRLAWRPMAVVEKVSETPDLYPKVGPGRPQRMKNPRIPTEKSRRLAVRSTLALTLASAAFLAGCAPASPQLPAAAPSETAALAPNDPTSDPIPPAAAPTATVPRDIPVRQATATSPAAVPTPTSLTVAGTTIDMSVAPGGVSSDGAMEIPNAFDRAAWYRFGPAPGAEAGTAVLAGHIDTTSDQAPLSQLKSLAQGTLIQVGRQDASTLNYRVVRVELMAKDKFDGESLFRRSGPHELKVVTCGGQWLDERMDYSDNVIVTAVLE